jgi:hypothetical protein
MVPPKEIPMAFRTATQMVQPKGTRTAIRTAPQKATETACQRAIPTGSLTASQWVSYAETSTAPKTVNRKATQMVISTVTQKVTQTATLMATQTGSRMEIPMASRTVIQKQALLQLCLDLTLQATAYFRIPTTTMTFLVLSSTTSIPSKNALFQQVTLFSYGLVIHHTVRVVAIA